MRRIAISLMLLAGCGVRDAGPPAPLVNQLDPADVPDRPAGDGDDGKPGPAVFDESDFDSTFRWAAGMIRPWAIASRDETSAVGTAESRAAAAQERHDARKAFDVALFRHKGAEVAWQAVVTKSGPGGVEFSADRSVGIRDESEESIHVFRMSVYRWTGFSGLVPAARVLRIGRDLSEEQAARLDAGDLITVEGAIDGWHWDEAEDAPPHSVGVILKGARLAGFAKDPALDFTDADIPADTSYERRLASLDAGRMLGDDDTETIGMSHMVQRATQAFGTNRGAVARIAMHVRSELGEARRMTHHAILRALLEVRDATGGRCDLPEASGLYLVARIEQGRDHGDAVATIGAAHRLLNGLSQPGGEPRVDRVAEEEARLDAEEATKAKARLQADEVAAQAKLRRAKGHMNLGQAKAAAARLNDVVANYPGTKAAKEAKGLLRRHGLGAKTRR